MFRPFLMILRGRLIIVTLGSVVMAIVAFFATSADGFTDFGVLWHHFCGCPPDPTDVRILRVSLTMICVITGAVLGFVTSIGASSGLTIGSSGTLAIGDTRFLLTRPVPKNALLLRPFVIAFTMIALLPVLAYSLLLGWLRLVHAPALAHMVADLALVPAAAMLGPHPSVFALLSAAHAGRFYVAAISVGLCAYALLAATRWIVLSEYKWLRYFAILPLVMLPLSPPFIMLASLGMQPSVLTWLLLLQPGGTSLDAQPSVVAIALHLAIAAAILLCCSRLATEAEL